jgi:hypothetical protein
MLTLRAVSICLAAALLSMPSLAQRGHRNPPDIFQDESRLPAAANAKPDPKLMLDQANDLKALSDAIPADIQNVNQGLISKDLGTRLKKIEKLAKNLREEIQRR